MKPDPSIDKLVERLTELLAKATPGPWEAQGTQTDGEDRGVGIVGLRLNDDGQPIYTPTNGIVAAALPHPTEIDEGDYTRVEANARLIVEAINALPTLLAALSHTGAGQGEAIPADKRTMTISLTEREQAALERLMEEQDLSAPQVFRCALREYQMGQERRKAGETVSWSGDEQRARDFAGPLARTLPTTPPADVAAVREQAVAYLKTWKDGTRVRRRVDLTSSCEPWLDALNPTITPLFRALPLSPATEGMVLVPREPTEAMLSRGLPWLSTWQHMRQTDRRNALANVWTAMLAVVETDHG